MSRPRFTPGLRVAMMFWEGRQVERFGHVIEAATGSGYVFVKFDGFTSSIIVPRSALRIVKTEGGK